MLVTFILGLVSAGYLGRNILQENAKKEVLQDARILMDSALAIRNYTVSEIRPLLNRIPTEEFLPQTVPAYSANANFKHLRQKHKEYSYKEATINPTNPENKATDWENDIILYFRDNPETKEYFGTRDTAIGKASSLFLSKPIKITNPNCLTCHSDPKNAPEALLEKYGNSNGFGWKLNSIIGAQIVSVPMTYASGRAETAFKSFIIMIIGIFTLLWAMMNILLYFVIVKPIRKISDAATAISTGSIKDNIDIEVKGNDEISSLAKSFNRMSRSLSNAMKMIE